MPPALLPPLFAVHISDGVLQPTWLLGGFVVATAFAFLGAWRIRDEEIPRIALLTAAFFVASSIHIRIGPSSWHLLFNGMVGIILGRRAALAIPIGLGLQYFLLMHGGFYSLGVNTCVMLFPALLAAGMFGALEKAPWLRQPWFRGLLIGGATLIWTLTCIYSVTLIATNHLRTLRAPELDGANAITFHPLTLTAALAIAVLAAWVERRVKAAPEFALGMVTGELTVLATISLACLVLILGGETDWSVPAWILFVLHLPIAALEGVVAGFLVGFLAQVKPDLLGWPTVDYVSTTPGDETERTERHALPEPIPLPAGVANGPVGALGDGRDSPGPSAACEVLRPAGE